MWSSIPTIIIFLRKKLFNIIIGSNLRISNHLLMSANQGKQSERGPKTTHPSPPQMQFMGESRAN